MSRTCSLSAVLLISTVARIEAAPILLVEFSHRNAMKLYAPSPPPPTLLFAFDAYNSVTGLNFLHWENDYAVANIGITFLAPQNVVDDANQSIVLPNTTFSLATGPANFSDPLRITSPTCGNSCVDVFVPNLSRYRITSVERIIDQFELTDQPLFDTYIFNGGQRIRYLGEVIPEPTSTALVFAGLTTGGAIRSRRVRSYGWLG